VVGVREFPNDPEGHLALLAWAQDQPAPRSIGVEGSGNFGAALCRTLCLGRRTGPRGACNADVQGAPAQGIAGQIGSGRRGGDRPRGSPGRCAPLATASLGVQGYDLPSPPCAKSPSEPLSCLLPGASLKDVISETRRTTSERGVNPCRRRRPRRGRPRRRRQRRRRQRRGRQRRGRQRRGRQRRGRQRRGRQRRVPSRSSSRTSTRCAQIAMLSRGDVRLRTRDACDPPRWKHPPLLGEDRSIVANQGTLVDRPTSALSQLLDERCPLRVTLLFRQERLRHTTGRLTSP